MSTFFRLHCIGGTQHLWQQVSIGYQWASNNTSGIDKPAKPNIAEQRCAVCGMTRTVGLQEQTI